MLAGWQIAHVQETDYQFAEGRSQLSFCFGVVSWGSIGWYVRYEVSMWWSDSMGRVCLIFEL